MTHNQGELFDSEPAPWEWDAAADILVATVVFPEAPLGTFDYLVPDELRGRLKTGARVQVPLGKGNRGVVGYCVRLGPHSSTQKRLKPISSIVDATPLMNPDILDLTHWLSDYYLCPWGTALEAVVPAGVRVQAGTRNVTFLDVSNDVAARLSRLSLPPKQMAALSQLVAAGRPLPTAELQARADCGHSPIQQLLKKGLIASETRRVHLGDPEAVPVPRTPPLPLNPDQAEALRAILHALQSRQHQTILLHGVTGSGKTEVYIQAIDEVIHYGRQAIVLVPEISLTPQTRRRFRSRFDRVAVLHSNLSPAERHGEWLRIARGEVQVIVGARSAIFAPVPDLGIVIIDEEHEPSFKQDTAPRYHAREVAARRTSQCGVPLVLGSATPSLESWYRSTTGAHTIVSLPSRVLNRPLPAVSTIDLRNEQYRRGARGSLSRPLRQAMKAALADEGQVILLLNRRGYSTHIQCPACGYALRCDHCDIAMTHHKSGGQIICHYCDARRPVPAACPQCHFDGIRFSGSGTQRLEAEVQAAFPTCTCLRMDTDTMKGHGAHEAALDRFRHGEVQILLGTQMIAKGLDFPNVTLVGVINADVGLHLPDFRAAERTFQLVTQVAGRTGRGTKGGACSCRRTVPKTGPSKPPYDMTIACSRTRNFPSGRCFTTHPSRMSSASWCEAIRRPARRPLRKRLGRPWPIACEPATSRLACWARWRPPWPSCVASSAITCSSRPRTAKPFPRH